MPIRKVLADGQQETHRDRIAHDHGSLVQESVEWLCQQSGMREVIHEDLELLLWMAALTTVGNQPGLTATALASS